MSNSVEKLQEEARLTLISNRVSEKQIKNLKAYPFIFFNDVTDVALDYDFSRTPAEIAVDIPGVAVTMRGRVEYKISASVAPDLIEKRTQALADAVRILFWKDTLVSIYLNDKEVFNG